MGQQIQPLILLGYIVVRYKIEFRLILSDGSHSGNHLC